MRVPLFARFQGARGPLVGMLVGLILGMVGFYLGFVASSGSGRDLALIDNAFVPDKASLDARAPETEVVIQGTLEGNTELDEYGLVGYVIHRLVERSSSTSSGITHHWEFVQSDFALLNLQIEGGSVLMTSPGEIVVITGSAHEVIDTSEEFAGRAKTFVYNGQRLTTGARRIRGVRNGDVVTVIGTRTGSGGVFIRRIHAGDRESFKAALEGESTGTGLIGYGLMALGVLVLAISLIAVFRRSPTTS